MEALPVATIACPYCQETINAKSKKCRFCGEILDPQMQEIQLLKSQNTPHVFMNAGGAAAAASASGAGPVRRFRHWLHIILTLISGGLWLPVYILMYVFRNRRYYY